MIFPGSVRALFKELTSDVAKVLKSSLLSEDAFVIFLGRSFAPPSHENQAGREDHPKQIAERYAALRP